MKRARLLLRVRILSVAVIGVGFLLMARLYNLQVLNTDYYLAQAEEQYVHTKTDLYTRGSILFSNQDGTTLSAATVQSGYLLAANPEHLTVSPQDFCSALEEYLDDPLEDCVRRVSVEGRVYVELASRLSEEQSDAVEEKDLDGAMLYKNQWRYYPGDSLSARIIGFVGYSDDGSELHGKYGLERHYDDVLFKKRQVMSVNFFAELFSNLGEMIYDRETDGGKTGDVVTTLEPAVSRMLDDILQKTNDKYQSNLTAAIVMDPQTGEIIAMNAVPGFDLNDRSGATIEHFRNPLVEDVYEFGSTIKALTMAAGLDSGAVTPETTYYDAGQITLDKFTIRNYDGRGRGTVPMQEVLNQSLNTGVSWIVTQMGKEKFRDYFLNYKLGSETGIDLPNEVHGLIENLKSPRDVEYATASFGQGIAMTPIETIRALAVLGNGGRLVTPHLVKRIEYDDGEVKEIRYPEGSQVISEKASEEVSRMLSVVVDKALKHGQVALPHHTIGAKTGTAQIPDPVNGGYYDDKYLHSFFGYFPAFDPKFIVFMYTVEPKGVQYASETLTDPFMDIAKFLINYYSIPPDR